MIRKFVSSWVKIGSGLLVSNSTVRSSTLRASFTIDIGARIAEDFVEDALQGEHDIIGRERRTVLPFDIRPKLEAPYRRAGLRPFNRERRLECQVAVVAHQGFVDVREERELHRLLPCGGIHGADIAVVAPAEIDGPGGLGGDGGRQQQPEQCQAQWSHVQILPKRCRRSMNRHAVPYYRAGRLTRELGR